MIQFKGQLFGNLIPCLIASFNSIKWVPYSCWMRCFRQGSGQINVIQNRYRYLLISATNSTSLFTHTYTHMQAPVLWRAQWTHAGDYRVIHLTKKHISSIATDIQSHNVCVIRMDVVQNRLPFFSSFWIKKEKFLHSRCVRQHLLIWAKIYIRNTYNYDDSTLSTYLTNVHRMNNFHRRKRLVLLIILIATLTIT